jgi:hypothetical protein
MAEGGFQVSKIGRLFRSGKATENRKRDLLEKIHRAALIAQEEQCPRFQSVVIARLSAARDLDYRNLLNTKDEQDRLKLIGAVSAIDRFFRELADDKKSGLDAAIELEKIKAQEKK